jgi:parallel beta-helix repeat protein
MSKKHWLPLLASVILVLLAPAPVGASTGVLTVTSTLTLTEDHQGAIVIAGDDLTLDCAGHAVSGPGEFGIRLEARTGVTVRNCDVSGFQHGVAVLSSTGSTITGNRSHNNLDTGFVLDHGSGNTLTGNNAETNGGNGFQLVSVSNTTLDHNTASHNGGTASR